jgi:hypothetical protein
MKNQIFSDISVNGSSWKYTQNKKFQIHVGKNYTLLKCKILSEQNAEEDKKSVFCR